MSFRAVSFLGKMRNKPLQVILLFVWISGIFLGLHIASSLDAKYYVHYYTAAREPAGFTGLLAVFFLPFLAVTSASYFKKIYVLFPAAGLIAFCLGFNLTMVQSIFGQGAWLAQFFLMFSETCVCVLLMWLICICLKRNEKSVRKHCILYSVTAFTLALIDYYLISPFFSCIL